MPTEWTQQHIDKGFPWCDECGEAALFNEFFGNRHSTPEYPWGTPGDQGHTITFEQWAEAGRRERAK